MIIFILFSFTSPDSAVTNILKLLNLILNLNLYETSAWIWDKTLDLRPRIYMKKVGEDTAIIHVDIWLFFSPLKDLLMLGRRLFYFTYIQLP